MPRIYKSKNKRAKIHSRQHGLCALCGQPLKLDEATLDHIVPRSKGGCGIISNLQAAHGRCNQDKGADYSGDPLSAGPLSRLPPIYIQAAKPAKHSRRGKRGAGCS
jgi:5-methylcytosine-specific restriction endonuclease McrA